MAYATIQLVETVLAQTLTSGTSSVANGDKISMLDFGNMRNENTISDDVINRYIQWSDEEVDGALSEMYEVPLCEKADLEMDVLFNLSEYNTTLEVSKAENLIAGDVIVIFDEEQEERHIVDSIANNTIIETVDTIVGTYDAADTRLIRVKFPPPIPLISARLAAANIYDKYFSAQADPNVTEYGKLLRNMAIRDLNNILNGRTVLHGQRRIGHRFLNPYLRDRYRLPGTKADQDSSRDIGKIE